MSGWKTATIKTSNDTKISNLINEKQEKNEKLKKKKHNSFSISGYNAEIIKEAKELLEEAEASLGDKLLVIEANNTTDSGDGTLYTVDKDKNGEIVLNKSDTFNGYEGAMAHDVTGYFRENHDINGVARHH